MKRKLVFLLLACAFSHQSKAQAGKHNYVKTVAPTVAATSTAGLSVGNSMASCEYFDDLGRPWQTVQVGMNPGKLDLVTYQEYDAAGRNSASWLPVTAASGNNGNPLLLTTVQSRSQLSSNYGESKAYSKPVYESSPLNRILEQYGPGRDWHDNNKRVQTEYLTNAATGELACRWYHTTDTRELVQISVDSEKVYYPAGELYVTRITDENGTGVHLEFKNKQGRLLLTREKNGTACHDTYYVYDVYGNLRAVLPPLAADALADAGSWVPDNAGMDVLSLYSYLYKYDYRNRLVARKFPGAGWTRYEYDRGDRMICSQDAEQATQSPALCTFYLYDNDNRPVVQGTCEFRGSIASLSSTAMLTSLQRSPDGTVLPTGLGNSGYSHNMALYSSVAYIVNYYDDYGFLSLTGFDDKAHFRAGSHPAGGLLTGTVAMLLDGSGKKLYTAYYYDEKGRLEKTVSSNHLGGYDTSTTVYTFTGKPKTVTHVHTASGKSTQTQVYTYAYDHADRLTTVTHRLNSNATVTLSSSSYDDLCRLSVKKLAGGAYSGSYGYNVRGWLTHIRGSKFTQNLYYNTGNGIPCYNGNISSMTWKSGDDSTLRGYKFTYDALNRLHAAAYGESSTLNVNLDRFSERVTGYDKNGNILGLQRYGQTGAATYGLLDHLTYSLDGNLLSRVDDAVTASAYSGGFEFHDGAKQADEYAYDKNGNLTQDLNKNIISIQNNLLNLPGTVTFGDGSTIAYTYAADGTKLRTVHKIGNTTTTTDYCGAVVYENGVAKWLLTDAGYVSLSDNKYHYYLQDHQGNNRVVLDSSGQVKETNNYYPFGGVFAGTGNVQPYKYNGKELDAKKGLDWYDYGARHYDAALGRWHAVDPLAEKYYGVSPYGYCKNNPVNRIDLDGRDDYVINRNGFVFHFSRRKYEDKGDRVYYSNNSGKPTQVSGEPIVIMDNELMLNMFGSQKAIDGYSTYGKTNNMQDATNLFNLISASKCNSRVANEYFVDFSFLRDSFVA